MRGLFFDVADLINGTKQGDFSTQTHFSHMSHTPFPISHILILLYNQDRGWAKRHAGAGKGKRLAYANGNVSVSWAWWTLNESARSGTDWRLPPQPDLDEWGLSDADSA